MNAREWSILPVWATAVLVGLTLCPTTAWSASTQQVTVRPDRQSISMGEIVNVEITLAGDFDSTNGPELNDFDVVGRSSGTSMSIINGQVSREQRVTLALAPRRPGKLVVGAVEMLANNQIVARSRPISIEVLEQGTHSIPSNPTPSGVMGAPGVPQGQATEPEEPAEPSVEPVPPSMTVPARLANERMFLTVRAPDRQLYVGEPVTIEYVLLTRARMALTSIRLESQPKLTGFVVEEPGDDSDNPQSVRIGQNRFDARVIWRSAVTAIEPGKTIVDSMGVSVTVGDFFDRRRHSLKSDPVALEFLEVPSEGRPADYIPGTVGNFVLTAQIDRENIKVGQTAVMTVEVNGAGNLRAIRPPKFNPPKGIRIDKVPSRDLDALAVGPGGVTGKRTFQFLVTADEVGKFDVGRVDLPYFNPISGKYERARSEILKVRVDPPAGGPVIEAKATKTTDPGVAIERTPGEGPKIENGGQSNMKWILAGMSIPLIFFLWAETVSRVRGHSEKNRDKIARRKALGRAKALLAGLEHAKDSNQFWTGLDHAIKEFLNDRWGMTTTGRSHDELRHDLAAIGAPEERIAEILNEIEVCAFGRFAPAVALDSERSNSLQRVSKCLAELDRLSDKGVS